MRNQCFFIGHRNAPDSVYDSIIEAAERLIITQSVRHFVVGHYGSFDRMSAAAIAEIKKDRPEITLTMLLPYHPSVHPFRLPAGFDDSLYPFYEHPVPYHAAIAAANQYMINHCSHLIMYAKHIGSNTRNFLDYAKARAEKGLLHIINLADNI